MLTPEDIEHRRFLVALRGYDREEVDAFLSQVAEQLKGHLERIRQLERTPGRAGDQQGDDSARDRGGEGGTTTPLRRVADVGVRQEGADVADMFSEVTAETRRILEAAQEASTQIRRKAKQAADRELQSARGQAARLIAEGERRREAIEAVVASLERARGGISEELRSVGRTIETTLRELGPGEDTSSVREAFGDRGLGARHRVADADTVEEQRDASPADAGLVDAQPGAERSADRASGGSVATGADAERESGQPAAPPDVQPDNDAVSVDPPAAGGEPREDTTFASLRQALGGAAEDTPPAPAAEAAGAEEERGASAEDDPRSRRAAALSALHPKLVRRVKRALQDLQNITLDRLRRAEGGGGVDDSVFDAAEVAAMGPLAGEQLREAYAAGARAAAALADQPLSPDAFPDAVVDEFVADGAQRVREPLVATLRMGMDANEDSAALQDRVRAVFGDLKSTAADELAASHLVHAYELGLLDTWKRGDVPHRYWLLGNEARCPEGRCRHNDRTGPVEVGEPFPSGHMVPPIHVGCTCTTVPYEPGESDSDD